MSVKKPAAKLSPLMRVLRVLYWIIFAVALVIVVVFAAFKLFINPPDVDSQVTINPGNPSPAVSDPAGDPAGPTDDPEPTSTPLVLTRRDGVYTCLLAGSDDGNGMADTIMLGVFDTNSQTASLISVPRDSLVEINGNSWKINASYGLGGVELLRDTVSETLVIPVDYYVMVDLKAFSAIVNKIGGVWFTVPQNMDYDDPAQDLHIHLKAGYRLLNGEDALGLMRFRKGYDGQDIGRVQVQRDFLVAMVKQTITLSNVSKVTSLIQILSQYVDSDMPLNTMIYFATQAIGMDLDSGLNSVTLPGQWINPYYELDDAGVLEIINSLGIYEEELPAEVLNIRHQ